MKNNEDIDLKIYFHAGDIEHIKIKPPAIIFSPIDDRWNDFTFKCRYKYFLHYGGDQKPIHGHVFLGFLSHNENIEDSGRISREVNFLEANQFPAFFTLQGGMEDYRAFIKKHGIDSSTRLLLELNDLVASRRVTKRAKLIEDAVKTKVFSLAFMREAERFFAFHNADSILDGLDKENFSKISAQLSLSYELAGFYGKRCFDFKFDTNSILPKRICVLIGRNGLGKSQALHAMTSSLLKGDSRFSDHNGERPIISRVLAIATPGETMNTFPPEGVNKRIKYRRLMLSRSARTKASRGFCDLCVQLCRSLEFIGNNDRWELFKDSIQFFQNANDIVIPLSSDISVSANHVLAINGKYYVPLLKLNHGGEQAALEVQGAVISNANPMIKIDGQIYPLSSGQLSFIKFVIQACLFIENGTLVLLDEPETHLHPNFISEFVRVLDRLLKMTGSISVIATHSAYFVREIPRTQVLVFKEGKHGQVNIQNPRLKTFGADVGAISYFVFEDGITNGLVDDLLDNFPQPSRARNALLKELEDELSSDVVMYLRRKLVMEDNNEKN